ncbi:MAG: hypothetical protein WC390_08505 [Sulfurimonas sp.]|jgi:hypothetical protein
MNETEEQVRFWEKCTELEKAFHEMFLATQQVMLSILEEQETSNG